MEFLPRSVATDDAGGDYQTHNGVIPPKYHASIYGAIARIQVNYSNISISIYCAAISRLPHIDAISVLAKRHGPNVRNNDSSHDIKLLPYFSRIMLASSLTLTPAVPVA